MGAWKRFAMDSQTADPVIPRPFLPDDVRAALGKLAGLAGQVVEPSRPLPPPAEWKAALNNAQEVLQKYD